MASPATRSGSAIGSSPSAPHAQPSAMHPSPASPPPESIPSDLYARKLAATKVHDAPPGLVVAHPAVTTSYFVSPSSSLQQSQSHDREPIASSPTALDESTSPLHAKRHSGSSIATATTATTATTTSSLNRPRTSQKRRVGPEALSPVAQRASPEHSRFPDAQHYAPHIQPAHASKHRGRQDRESFSEEIVSASQLSSPETSDDSDTPHSPPPTAHHSHAPFPLPSTTTATPTTSSGLATTVAPPPPTVHALTAAGIRAEASGLPTVQCVICGDTMLCDELRPQSAARKRRPFNCCQNCYMGLWRDVQRVVQRRAARPEFATTRKIPIQLQDFLQECPAVGKPCLKLGSDGMGGAGPCPVRAIDLHTASLSRPAATSSSGGDTAVRLERCTRCRTAAMAQAMPDLTRRLLDKAVRCKASQMWGAAAMASGTVISNSPAISHAQAQLSTLAPTPASGSRGQPSTPARSAIRAVQRARRRMSSTSSRPGGRAVEAESEHEHGGGEEDEVFDHPKEDNSTRAAGAAAAMQMLGRTMPGSGSRVTPVTAVSPKDMHRSAPFASNVFPQHPSAHSHLSHPQSHPSHAHTMPAPPQYASYAAAPSMALPPGYPPVMMHPAMPMQYYTDPSGGPGSKAYYPMQAPGAVLSYTQDPMRAAGSMPMAHPMSGPPQPSRSAAHTPHSMAHPGSSLGPAPAPQGPLPPPSGARMEYYEPAPMYAAPPGAQMAAGYPPPMFYFAAPGTNTPGAHPAIMFAGPHVMGPPPPQPHAMVWPGQQHMPPPQRGPEQGQMYPHGYGASMPPPPQ